ncbi:MAG TPA: DUF5916 domain-containing protein [Flavobacterium sp.]|jgi:hypothetical protein
MRFCYFLLLFFVVALSVSAQEKPQISRRSYTTKSLGEMPPPVIDGLLEDSSWDIVEWTGDYIENEPDENTPPTEQTRFKVLYDARYIYFAFRCYDRDPDGIVRRLSRRDGFEGDWVEVNIDSYSDKRTGFSFTISASGVKGDEFISDNGNMWDGSWNPIWYVKTNVDSEGWTAEVKIPLSQLKFGDSKEQIWGLQSTRRYFRAEERSLWQRVPRDAPGWVSEFGELRGLLDLQPQKQLEIQPFVVTQLETYPKEPGNPFRDGSDLSVNGGVDAKIGITNDLTLDLTINPDFGQVEADPAAIALDGFQIFFEEKRPFFVENKNIFNFNFADGQDNLFYSRRIGRSPQARAITSAGEFSDVPTNSTILGAAKFSGKTKGGWSIGLLESVTKKEMAEVVGPAGDRNVAVEPLTNYLVARVQKDFNNRNSYLGAIVTSTNRSLEEPHLGFLRESAYTTGIDFKHNWKNRKYFVTGNAVLSHVTGSKEAIAITQQEITHLFQRADASHVSVDPNRTSLTGTGGRIEAGKSAVGNWRYYGVVNWRSPELELNDMGFLRQADEIRQYAILTYQTLKPFGWFRRIDSRFEQLSTHDFEGNHNRMHYNLTGSANFKSNWYANTQILFKTRNFSNSALQGGPRFLMSDDVFYSAGFGSDSRKKFRFNAGVYTSRATDRSSTYAEIDGGFAWQPINALTMSVYPNYSRNANKLQYVTTTAFGEDPRYITAAIDQRTLSAAIRFDYTIDPNLTVQYYGQPFISRGRYSRFNRVTKPDAEDYANRNEVFSTGQIWFSADTDSYAVDEDQNGTVDYTVGNPDFSVVQFRSNLVVRWEYIPGSEIFLVWSQGINGLANPHEDLWGGLNSQILHNKPENIFLLKATYRFVL